MAEIPINPSMKDGFQVGPPITGPTGQFLLSVSLKMQKARKVQVSGTYTTVDATVNVGATEPLAIPASTQVRFSKAFLVDYWFESLQMVTLTVEDADVNASSTPIASTRIALGSILSTKGEFKVTLVTDATIELYIISQPVEPQEQELMLHLVGESMDKKDTFGKSDPFYLISRVQPNGTLLPVYRSRYEKQTLNPEWLPAWISTSALGGVPTGDHDPELEIGVWDYDSSTKQDYIGSARMRFSELLTPNASFLLIHPKKKLKKKDYVSSGKVIVKAAGIGPKLTMAHWTKGGRLNFNLTVAVDFTGSNGPIGWSGSLHEKSSGNNQYQQVMKSVGQVLMPYSSDGLISAYGFGGARKMKTSFCFPLAENDSPQVAGLEGLLEAYGDALKSWALSAPTYLAPMVEAFCNVSAQKFNDSKADGLFPYSVLLIITDGVIDDQQATIQKIVAGSYHPVSIIIVGVGNANFDSMDKLDSDKRLLTCKKDGLKMRAARDIVQFVPFLRFKDDSQRLASEVLKELPMQVVEFMRHANIAPEH